MSLSQTRFILSELVKKGIRLKYRRSYLGILWSLLEPLLTMIVLTVVFGTLMGVHDKTFPVYILAGRLLYGYFSLATTTALKSIRQNSAMIKKVYVPRLLYPLSATIFHYVIFLISLIVLVVVAGVLGVRPTWHLVQIFLPLGVLFLLGTGVGIFLSTVGVFFRDMEYLWTVILMLVMYTAAIFYHPEALLSSRYGLVLRLNPLFCVIENFRDAIFGNPLNVGYLMYALAFSMLALLMGILIFRRNEDKFILYI